MKVTSDVEIAGFEFVRTVGQDLLGLNAQPVEDQLSNLYFPQLAVLGPWETELNLVNTSEQSVILTLSVFQENGFLFDTGDLANNPIVRTLDGGASLSEDVEAMFGFTGDSVQQGWLLVESTSAAINGSISYGLAGSVASVTASATGQKRALFSHIATSGGFFTGVALLNSGQLATNVRLLAITPAGQVLGSYNTVLQPGQRVSQLIDQLIPQAAELNGGLIWVKSESPIHLTSVFGNPTVLANIPPQQAPESYEPDSDLSPVVVTPGLAVLQLGQSQPFQITGLEDVDWNVNGVAGGSESAGSVTESGIYEAPEAVPDQQVLTVIAESGGQAAGASVDILQKENLLISSAIVQSVAYLGSLDRLYTAELTLLSSSEEGPAPAAQKPAQTSGDTEIVEVSPTQVRVSLVEFAGEEISKMISFEASTGDEYLLAAAKTSGRVIRIDPRTRETQDVATGLNQPESLVLDPVTGDLLVAESDKVSSVSQSDLEAGLSAALRLSPDRGSNQAQELFPADQVDGITVDLCTGTIYISNRASGEILAYDRDNEQLSAIFRGLDEPTRLQSINRLRVSCPDASQILALELGIDVVDLLSPTRRSLRRWIAASGSTDLAILEEGSFGSDGILLTETVEEDQVKRRTVSAIATDDIFGTKRDNPPIVDPMDPVAPVPDPDPEFASLSIGHGGPGSGLVDVSPLGGCDSLEGSCSFQVASGTFVRLAALGAEPGDTGEFSSGSGSALGCAGSTCSFVITENSGVTATWESGGGAEVGVGFSGEGMGEVTADQNVCSGPSCSFSYAVGSLVTLRVEPSEESSFGGFSGDCVSSSSSCRFAITLDSSVTATFNPAAVELNPNSGFLVVERVGTGRGTVTGGGIECPPECSTVVPSDTEVSLTASPEGEAIFEGWRGACGGTGGCTVLVDSPKVVTAIFQLPFTQLPPAEPPVEEPCLTNDECESGLCVGGFCAPPGVEVCETNDECESGLCLGGFCAPEGVEVCEANEECESGLCIGGFCSPPGALMACEADDECESGLCVGGFCAPPGTVVCETNEECESGMCVGGFCAQDPPFGAMCETNEECESGMCIGGFCSPPGAVACETNEECESGMCEEGFCRQEPPPGAVACETNEECESGMCEEGFCRQEPPPGAVACEMNEECESGMCVEGFCTQEPPSGEMCETNEECESGFCVEGFCAPPGAVACETNEECESGMCEEGFCRQEPPPGAMMCETDAECESGMCEEGFCRQEPPPGAMACETNQECESGMCEGGFCVPEHGHGGAACEMDEECESGMCVEGFCTEEPPSAPMCETDADCEEGVCAEVGFCVPDSPPGGPETCETDSDCMNGTCDQGFCIRDDPPGGPGMGEACGSNAECASGFCVDNFCAEPPPGDPPPGDPPPDDPPPDDPPPGGPPPDDPPGGPPPGGPPP